MSIDYSFGGNIARGRIMFYLAWQRDAASAPTSTSQRGRNREQCSLYAMLLSMSYEPSCGEFRFSRVVAKYLSSWCHKARRYLRRFRDTVRISPAHETVARWVRIFQWIIYMCMWFVVWLFFPVLVSSELCKVHSSNRSVTQLCIDKSKWGTICEMCWGEDNTGNKCM